MKLTPELEEYLDTLSEEEFEEYFEKLEEEAEQKFFEEHGYYGNVIDPETGLGINPLYYDELDD